MAGDYVRCQVVSFTPEAKFFSVSAARYYVLDIFRDLHHLLHRRDRAGKDPQAHARAHNLAERVEPHHTPRLAVDFLLKREVAAGPLGRVLLKVEEVVRVVFKNHEVKALGELQSDDN